MIILYSISTASIQCRHIQIESSKALADGSECEQIWVCCPRTTGAWKDRWEFVLYSECKHHCSSQVKTWKAGQYFLLLLLFIYCNSLSTCLSFHLIVCLSLCSHSSAYQNSSFWWRVIWVNWKHHGDFWKVNIALQVVHDNLSHLKT